MFQINELSKRSGVSRKTIRYYEEIGLLPYAQRTENGYRVYRDLDVERVTFIKSARRLDFSLDDIREILAFRERGEPPCSYVMGLMKAQIEQIEEHIRELNTLRAELERLHTLGQQLPEDIEMKDCVCHLIKEGYANGH